MPFVGEVSSTKLCIHCPTQTLSFSLRFTSGRHLATDLLTLAHPDFGCSWAAARYYCRRLDFGLPTPGYLAPTSTPAFPAFTSPLSTAPLSWLAPDLTMAVPEMQATSASERFEQRLRAPPRISSMIWDSERWWIDHRLFRGYMLRPRYQPGWEPYWHSENDTKGSFHAEGSVPVRVSSRCHSF